MMIVISWKPPGKTQQGQTRRERVDD